MYIIKTFFMQFLKVFSIVGRQRWSGL